MKNFSAYKAILQQSIVTNIHTRGDGVKTPVRKVTQVFTTTGTLIAEDDPLSYTIDDLVKIHGDLPSNATLEDFMKRLTTLNNQ